MSEISNIINLWSVICLQIGIIFLNLIYLIYKWKVLKVKKQQTEI